MIAMPVCILELAVASQAGHDAKGASIVLNAPCCIVRVLVSVTPFPEGPFTPLVQDSCSNMNDR